jgi:hypothetical protein
MEFVMTEQEKRDVLVKRLADAAERRKCAEREIEDLLFKIKEIDQGVTIQRKIDADPESGGLLKVAEVPGPASTPRLDNPEPQPALSVVPMDQGVPQDPDPTGFSTIPEDINLRGTPWNPPAPGTLEAEIIEIMPMLPPWPNTYSMGDVVAALKQHSGDTWMPSSVSTVHPNLEGIYFERAGMHDVGGRHRMTYRRFKVPRINNPGRVSCSSPDYRSLPPRKSVSQDGPKASRTKAHSVPKRIVAIMRNLPVVYTQDDVAREIMNDGFTMVEVNSIRNAHASLGVTDQHYVPLGQLDPTGRRMFRKDDRYIRPDQIDEVKDSLRVVPSQESRGS